MKGLEKNLTAKFYSFFYFIFWGFYFSAGNLKIQVCRTDKIPLGTKGRTSILSYREYVRPAELHSRSAEKNCLTENVSSLRSVKGATLPCDACASIPCGLAVRKQHEMLFAASKFGKINTENQTVDWSQCAKS